MLFATGWVVVRSSRQPYETVVSGDKLGTESVDLDLDAIDAIDGVVQQADEILFDRLEAFLADFNPPDLDWHFRRRMNNESGLLQFYSSRNHRSSNPTAIQVLTWLASNG